MDSVLTTSLPETFQLSACCLTVQAINSTKPGDSFTNSLLGVSYLYNGMLSRPLDIPDLV